MLGDQNKTLTNQINQFIAIGGAGRELHTVSSDQQN